MPIPPHKLTQFQRPPPKNPPHFAPFPAPPPATAAATGPCAAANAATRAAYHGLRAVKRLLQARRNIARVSWAPKSAGNTGQLLTNLLELYQARQRQSVVWSGVVWK